MIRKTIDCRRTPSDSNCTLMISGAEEEVLTAAAHHASTVHGHTDYDELRDVLRNLLTDDEGPSAAGAFVQLVEFESPRIEDWDAIQDRVVAALGSDRTTRWSILGADRDRPGSYVAIVEFPDHTQAMANSTHPATGRFAEELGKISTSGPAFRNLDVRRARAY